MVMHQKYINILITQKITHQMKIHLMFQKVEQQLKIQLNMLIQTSLRKILSNIYQEMIGVEQNIQIILQNHK